MILSKTTFDIEPLKFDTVGLLNTFKQLFVCHFVDIKHVEGHEHIEGPVNIVKF